MTIGPVADEESDMVGLNSPVSSRGIQVSTASTGVPAGVAGDFEVFGSEAPAHAASWMNATQALDEASALDEKTRGFSRISRCWLRFAWRAECRSMSLRRIAMVQPRRGHQRLLGLQPAGHGVTACLPAALDAYDGL